MNVNWNKLTALVKPDSNFETCNLLSSFNLYFLVSVMKYHFYLYVIENWFIMSSFNLLNKASQKSMLFLKI